MVTGLHRNTVGPLLDRLRMTAALVAQEKREHIIFEDCQVEANESVVRKERVYDTADGQQRVGTIHHSVVALTRRGSTQTVAYLCEPKYVPVNEETGKPSPPSLPSTALVLPLLTRHLGNRVVLHTDGAEAYAAAIKQLQEEGWAVVHDNVVHSHGQWTAFGRHNVTEVPGWECCEFALTDDFGQRRIRVEKGTQKIEGWWRHVKHDDSGIPPEIKADDGRLNLYVQALVWRCQTCGDPLREVMSLCRAFRALPIDKKQIVWQHKLRIGDGRKACLTLPVVTYARWEGVSEGDEK